MVETAWIALRKIEIFMHAQESPKSTNLHAKHVVRHVSDRGPNAYCKVHLKSLVQHIRTSDSQYQTLERGSICSYCGILVTGLVFGVDDFDDEFVDKNTSC